ncbi:MAG TPA: ABC transporter substrate-binding protein [Bryobacteraceae bacterium]|nr:ABC transporter substrate-binding protein [Bryobacteraceae bacterium]
MRLRASAWLALSSLLAASAIGATRPRYGGTLSVELSTPWTSLDPADRHGPISPAIAETLVRLNSRGQIEPLLATAWRLNGKRWTFSLRPKVVFHDGEPLNAANAAPALLAALKRTHGDVSVLAGGQTLVVQSESAIPDLLLELAAPRTAIFRKSDTNPLIGTGPFRVAAWEPGRRLSLAAFDDYWGGRPYLDAVNISFGAGRVRADIFDIPSGPGRRILPEGTAIWSSAPRKLVALLGANALPPLMQALAVAIDRSPIVNVLAQKRGEPAFGLLPQWLSGYAFLFQAPPELSRARQMAAPLRPGTLSVSYPPDDVFLRSVAERVALNARDAGMNIQPATSSNGNLSLVEWQLESRDAVSELARLAGLLGMADRAGALDASKPDSLYQTERALLDEHRVIPIIDLPDTYGVAPRVHQVPKSGSFSLPLEDLWVEQ